jgi:hypothetical protein
MNTNTNTNTNINKYILDYNMNNSMRRMDNIDKVYLTLCSLIIVSLLFVASKKVS